MTADQKHKIRSLLEGALGLDDSRRAAFIEETCQNDPTLHALVESLLEGRGAAKGFLGEDTLPGSLAPVFRPGDLVSGRFRIAKFQGRGGMGEVYEAYDERLRVRLALKTLRADTAMHGTDVVGRFQREILIAREVSHPNLCRVFDLVDHPSDTGAVVCLTMEWIEGETLQTAIARNRPLPLAYALRILEQVADAIDALHDAGIVHRDLKPGNIMLSPQADGRTRVVVMDFGLAKPTAPGAEWFESRDDAQAGAPFFMAPEQLRNERPTRASDIFSFGLVIDEMVTRSRAFEADSLAALYYQRLWEKPKAPSARAENLPARWESAILRCLEVEPEARFGRAGDVVAALSAGHQPPAVPPRRNPRWLSAGIAALVAAVALMALGTQVSAPRIETSMVVFPINDLAGDARHKHLPAGLISELVARLTRIDGLSVKRYYQPREKAPLASIRGRFHLDGDFQKYENRTRLTMRLTDSEKDGGVVWSDSFDASLDNPLELQSRVAGAVIAGLERRALREAAGVDQVKFAGFRALTGLRGFFSMQQTGYTSNPSAYHDYLRARQLLDERNPVSIRAGVDLLRRSIAADPAFAAAHALLADGIRAIIDAKQGSMDLLPDSRRAAEEAIRLAPNLAEGHLALAGVRQMEWDWKGSEQSYLQALEADPKLAGIYRRYGGLILQSGRFDQSLQLVRKGLALDPYDYPAQSAYGLCLTMARRYDEAITHLEHLLAQSDFITAHSNLASAYVLRAASGSGVARERDFARGLEEVAAIRRFELRGSAGGTTPLSDYWFALVHARRGDLHSFQEALARMLSGRDRANPVSLALVYAARQEKENAVFHLREAARAKDRGLLYLKVHPHWDPIRDTDGYREVVELMKL